MSLTTETLQTTKLVTPVTYSKNLTPTTDWPGSITRKLWEILALLPLIFNETPLTGSSTVPLRYGSHEKYGLRSASVSEYSNSEARSLLWHTHHTISSTKPLPYIRHRGPNQSRGTLVSLPCLMIDPWMTSQFNLCSTREELT